MFKEIVKFLQKVFASTHGKWCHWQTVRLFKATTTSQQRNKAIHLLYLEHVEWRKLHTNLSKYHLQEGVNLAKTQCGHLFDNKNMCTQVITHKPWHIAQSPNTSRVLYCCPSPQGIVMRRRTRPCNYGTTNTPKWVSNAYNKCMKSNLNLL